MTDAMLKEVRDWQNRTLDGVYPVVFFDALRVKKRDCEDDRCDVCCLPCPSFTPYVAPGSFSCLSSP